MADTSYRVPDFQCKACHGTKVVIRYTPVPEYRNRPTPFVHGKCQVCNGTGRQTVEVADYKAIASGFESEGL